jgi:hypothetical protein
MKTRLTVLLSLLTFAAIPFISGCDRAAAATGGHQLPYGKPCVVQFRRDALGMANPNPLTPTSGGLNGGITMVSGTLVVDHTDWLVLSTANGEEMWIPKSVVLLVQVPAKK